MQTFSIYVQGLSSSQLRRFVRRNIPAEAELLRRARLARLPVQDEEGTELTELVGRYYPLFQDLTLYICGIDDRRQRAAWIHQDVSGRESTRVIKRGLRQIVRRHLVKALRQKGHACTIHTDPE